MQSSPLLLLGAALATLCLVGQQPDEETAKEAAESLLFVHGAERVSYDAGTKTLALEKLSPVVTFFSDRPQRVVGHMTLAGFVKMWGEGDDSFDADPPNVAVSILGESDSTVAILTLSQPRLDGGRMTYHAELLEGDMPESGGISSLFFDGLLMGTGRGAALGAIGGAIAGNAGKGAAIGAAVIAGSNLLRGVRERRAF
jgi:hypothetical protein